MFPVDAGFADLTFQTVGFVLFSLVLIAFLLAVYLMTKKVDPTHDKCKQTRDRLQRDYEAAAASAVIAEERVHNIMKEFKREDKMTCKALERIQDAHVDFFIAVNKEHLSIDSQNLLHKVRRAIEIEIAKAGG